MAIIKLGALIAGIRGTLGGVTYAQNPSGPYAKTWARSSNPQSPSQQTQRRAISGQATAWRSLTPAQRTAWGVWAALPAQARINPLGETYNPTGFQWFVAIQVRLQNIGRTNTTSPPVGSIPGTPALASFQTPLVDGQGAFITYASGQFGPTYDLVLEIETTLSQGQTSAPQLFKTIAQTQAPPSTSFGFPIAYWDRIALTGSTLKSWARAYRQTSEGLRSSPASATFISSDAAPYAAAANAYDGATNFATRGADLTGAANSKVCTIYGWFRATSLPAAQNTIISSTNQFYWLSVSSAGKLRLRLRNAAVTTILETNSATTFAADGTWHSYIWSVDLAQARVQLAVDGALETPSIATGPTNDTIKWTDANHRYGGLPGPITLWNGCLSDTFLDITQSLDLSQPNALRAFLTPDGSPMPLGTQGAFPLGTQPIFACAAGDPSTNLGSGGNYTNNAALVACGSTP